MPQIEIKTLLRRGAIPIIFCLILLGPPMAVYFGAGLRLSSDEARVLRHRLILPPSAGSIEMAVKLANEVQGAPAFKAYVDSYARRSFDRRSRVEKVVDDMLDGMSGNRLYRNIWIEPFGHQQSRDRNLHVFRKLDALKLFLDAEFVRTGLVDPKNPFRYDLGDLRLKWHRENEIVEARQRTEQRKLEDIELRARAVAACLAADASSYAVTQAESRILSEELVQRLGLRLGDPAQMLKEYALQELGRVYNAASNDYTAIVRAFERRRAEVQLAAERGDRDGRDGPKVVLIDPSRSSELHGWVRDYVRRWAAELRVTLKDPDHYFVSPRDLGAIAVASRNSRKASCREA